MSAADRVVLAAVAFMFAAIPLQGTFGILDPLRPPIPPLVDRTGAIGIGLAMLAAAAVCAWGAVRKAPPRAMVAAQLAPGVAIAIAAVLGFDPPTGFMLAAIVLAFGCVGIAVDRYAATPAAARALVGTFLAASIASSGLALAMVALRRPVGLFAYNNGRAVGLFLNANENAAYLVVVLGVAAAVLVAVRSGPLRVLAALAAAVDILALVFTFSRSALAAAVCGLAAYALAQRDRRALAVTVLCAAIAGGVGWFAGEAYHSPRDDVARGAAWTTGVRTFAAFPFSGVGPLAFHRTYDVLRPPDGPGPRTPVAYDPHSLPLAFVDGSGIVGLAALVFGYTVYVRAIRRALRGAPAHRRAAALAAGAGVLALNVDVLINTISLFFALSAMTLALVIVLARTDLEPHAA
jgi:hypothetical protein